LLDQVMTVDIPQFQTDLSALRQMLATMPGPPPGGPPPPSSLDSRIGQAIISGVQKYTALNAPILAIYASPHALPPAMPEAQRAAMVAQDAKGEEQIKRFEAANPKAKVIRIAGAQHGVFASNPDQVAKAMNEFMDELK
jgi:non-heme chloroperoxidase